MPFWTYMLHCRGGYFYVGHTDDIEKRIGEHKSGLIPGFTADHQPVELVWSDQFANREDAKAAERKLKGWSRAKKLALVRGDWERISALAKKKDRASTSSAWTGKGESVVPKTVRPELADGSYFSLRVHPQSKPSQVKAVVVRIYMTDENDALFEFAVSGPDELLIPKPVTPRRSDGLWQTTCFELFLRSPGCDAYWEFNLSPSNEWAAYRFENYRDGMSKHPVNVDPQIETRQNELEFELSADVDFGGLPPGTLEIALSAVIEETDGTKSYWALVHPPGKPDFHHPACFAATLPAPSEP